MNFFMTFFWNIISIAGIGKMRKKMDDKEKLWSPSDIKQGKNEKENEDELGFDPDIFDVDNWFD